MEIFCTLVGYMNISRRKQGVFYFSINPPWKKLSLKTVGGDLEWELHNSLFSHEDEGDIYQQPRIEGKISIDLSFKLVQVSGMDFMKTIAYTLYVPFLLNEKVYGRRSEDDLSPLVVGTTYRRKFRRGSEFRRRYNTELKFSLRVQLQRSELSPGRELAAHSICRLYNNDDLADVELHCGSVVMKTHKARVGQLKV